MGLKVYINGTFYDKKNAAISVFDHGLLYGDGVFEGIRSYNRRVFKLKEHIDRLFESAHTIMLTMPLTKRQVRRAVVATLKRNKLKDAYIRLVVTRGSGDLGLDPKKCPSPTVIIITDNIVLYPEKFYRNGLDLMTVPTRRNVPEAINPQIKSLNYLNNILAKIEAAQCGFQEAIMLSTEGYVLECTGDNIFMVKNGELFTPPAYLGALRGITRDAVVQLARTSRIPYSEKIITRHELFNADECFLTGTAAEIIPVVKVDGRQIGNGKPGPVTKRLLSRFRLLTKRDGVCY